MTILVVGGYGHVGGQAARILAARGHVVRVAGRSLAKAERVATEIGASAAALDVNDPQSWEAALDGVELVLVCLDLPTAGLAERILAAGKRYIDISADDAILSAIERLDGVAREQGGRALLSVGLAPGLTNMMAHMLADRAGQGAQIDIGVMLGAGDSHGAAATDWTIAELARARGEPRTFHFAGDARARKAWPLGFADQHVLARTLPEAKARTYFALDDRFLTAYLFSMGRILARPLWMRPVLRRVFMSIRVGKPRTALSVIASVGGREVARASYEGGGEAELTAMIAARAVELLLARDVPPGVQHLGQTLVLEDFADLFESDALMVDGLVPGKPGAAECA